jgi:two-component system, cell cycle sensor histidine kinase and response regulator CckA
MNTSPVIPTTKRQSLVLIADDDQAIRNLLTSMIVRLGFVAICVGNGAAAIAAVEAHREKLSCAIMDIEMPIMNGVDAAYAIQAITPDLPILLMSGAIPDVYRDKISQLRIVDILTKPFSVVHLQDLLRHVTADGVALEQARTG